LRRCGKSVLMQLIRSKQKEKDCFFDFEDDRLVAFKLEDFQLLYELLIEKYGKQGMFFFDEVQNVDGWEKFVRRLHNQGDTILVTGSNAKLLSKEFGTHLTGRYLKIELYPFSFLEFLTYKNINIANMDFNSTESRGLIKRYFNEYFDKGGIPEFLRLENVEYLKSLYESILYKDIIVRHKLPNERLIKELSLYLASNIGKEISYNSLKNMLGAGSSTTVKDYVEFLQDSYVFFILPQFDYSLSKQLYKNKKVYCIDLALARTIGFRMSQDQGRMLENLVFLELKRRQKNIMYYKNKSECDFIVKEGSVIVEAIQVSMQLDNEETKKREYRGLFEAMDEFGLDSGLLLTFDDEYEESLNGKKILIKPVWKWLIGG